MTDKIVIGGTEFPTKGEVDGRTFTRYEGSLLPTKPQVGLYELFHERFQGPFTPIHIETSEPIPPCFGTELLETKAGRKRVVRVFDDLDNCDAVVVDSKGNRVTGPMTRLAAWTTAIALNKQPHGILDGTKLGLSPFHGVSKSTCKDKQAFWCIRVPTTSYYGGKIPVSDYSYVIPFYTRYELPGTTYNPLSALRFKSAYGAKEMIDLIRQEFLGDPKVVDDLKSRRDRWQKLVFKTDKEPASVNGRAPHSLEEWLAMEPVQVKYMYNISLF